jgi:hypothetical protein
VALDITVSGGEGNSFELEDPSSPFRLQSGMGRRRRSSVNQVFEMEKVLKRELKHQKRASLSGGTHGIGVRKGDGSEESDDDDDDDDDAGPVNCFAAPLNGVVSLKSDALFVFSGTNPLRLLLFNVVRSKPFDYVMMLIIFANCVFLALDDPTTAEDPAYYFAVDVTFAVLFSVELLLKVVAFGFAGHAGAYLRDGWNRLDFALVLISYFAFVPGLAGITVLRVLRVLRALRTMNTSRGIKIIVNGLFHSFMGRLHVMLLAFFVFAIFGIFGVQLYRGRFRMQCQNDATLAFHEEWHCKPDAPRHEHWGMPCPPGYTCRPGANPSYGFVNFDNVFWAVLVVFQVITFEGWPEVLHVSYEVFGTPSFLFYFALIMIGAYFVPNLALAVINDKYHEAMQRMEEQEWVRVMKENEERRKATLGAVGLIERTRRRSQRLQSNPEDAQQQIATLQGTVTIQVAPMSPFSPRGHGFDDDDGGAGGADSVPLSEQAAPGCLERAAACWLAVREAAHSFTQGYPLPQGDLAARFADSGDDFPYFQRFIIACIVLNTILLAAQHHAQPAWLDELTFVANIVFTGIFILELIAVMTALGFRRFFADRFYLVDLVIVILSIVELFFLGSKVISVFRALRLLRVVKLVRNSPSLRTLVEVILSAVSDTLHLSLFIGLLLFIAALLGMQIFGGLMVPVEQQTGRPVRAHFDTFYFAFYTVFQVITTDNWVNVMWNAMLGTNVAACGFFIILVLFGTYVMLNLFVSILIQGFEREAANDDTAMDEDDASWLVRLDVQHHIKRIALHQHRLGLFQAPDEVVRVSDEVRPWLVDDAPLPEEDPAGAAAEVRVGAVMLMTSLDGNGASEEEEDEDAEVAELSSTQRSHSIHVTSSAAPRRGSFVAFGAEKAESEGAAEPNRSPSMQGDSDASPGENPFAAFGAVTAAPDDSPAETGPFSAFGGGGGGGGGSFRAAFGGADNTASFRNHGGISAALGGGDSLQQQQSSSFAEPRRKSRGFGRSGYGGGSFAGGAGVAKSQPSGVFGTGGSASFRNAGKPAASGVFDASDDVAMSFNLPENDDYSRDFVPFEYGAPEEEPDVCEVCGCDIQRVLPVELGLVAVPERECHDEQHCQLAQLRRAKAAVLEAVIAFAARHADAQTPFGARAAALAVAEAQRSHMMLAVDAARDVRSWAALLDEAKEEREVLLLMVGEEQVGSTMLSYTRAGLPKVHRTNGGWALFVLGPENPLRVAVSSVVTHPRFDEGVLLLIVISSVLLALEDPRAEKAGAFYETTQLMNLIFAVVFGAEILARIVAQGAVQHKGAFFRDGWNWLDTVSLAASVVSGLSSLRSLRMLRALRPLRAIKRYRGLRMIVRTLLQSIIGIAHVAMLSMLNYLIFGILAVQLFGGKLFTCTDPAIHFKDQCHGAWYDPAIVRNDTRRWATADRNFDHIGRSMLSLFQVSTGDDWADVMYAAIDAAGHERAPIRDHRPEVGVFFVVFYIISNFFMLNLFIGIIIVNFDNVKQKIDGLHLLSDEQKMWVDVQRMLVNFRPEVRLVPGDFWLSRRADAVVRSQAFEVGIAVVIGLNIAVIASEHEGQPAWHTDFLRIANFAFVGIFAAEALMKIVAHGRRYFAVRWNRFDFFLVAIAFVAIALEGTNSTGITSFSIGVLRIFRLFRIMRIVRLFKQARKVQILLQTLWYSLPSIVNISLFMCIVYAVFAVIGVQLFARVPDGRFLRDRYFNFHNFPGAMQLMFIFTTNEKWSDAMYDCMVQEPYCIEADGTCGTQAAPIFFILLVLVSAFVVANLFIAIILDNFATTMRMDQSNVTLADLRRYTAMWSEYDEDSTLMIPVDQLPRLLARLQPPLGTTRADSRIENMRSMVRYEIPIHEGRVHFAEVLLPLAKAVTFPKMTSNETFAVHHQEDIVAEQFPEVLRLPTLWYDRRPAHVGHYVGATLATATWRRRLAMQQARRERARQRVEVAVFLRELERTAGAAALGKAVGAMGALAFDWRRYAELAGAAGEVAQLSDGTLDTVATPPPPPTSVDEHAPARADFGSFRLEKADAL